MGDIVNVLVNVPKLEISAKELIDFIMEKLDEMDYDAKLASYRFQKGKTPDEIKDLQFKIEANKPIDDYTLFDMTIELTAASAKTFKKGSKKILSGESKLVFLIKSVLDYDKRWEENPFLSFLKKIYEKYIYNNRIIMLEDKAEDELFDLVESVKSKIGVK